MTERMTHVLAAERLVSALAERRTIESDDRVTIALAALVAEIDGTEIPVLDLPGDPVAAPFKRRAGVAAVTVAALAFSSGGIAAAVTGDPLLPLRYVVGKLYEHAYPEDETDSDRWFVGQTQGDTAEGDPVAIRYASLTQSRSSERFAGRLTGSGPDGPGADTIADHTQFGTTLAGDGAQGDVSDEPSDTDAAADEPAADPGSVAGDEPTSEAPGATPETPAEDEPSLPGEPSPEPPAPPAQEDPEIPTGTPGSPPPDRPGGDRTDHGRDDDVVATHTEPGKPADPGAPADPGSPADGRPGEDGGHGGPPEAHTPPAQPDADADSVPGRPAGLPAPPVNLPHDRGPLPAAEHARHAAATPEAR